MSVPGTVCPSHNYIAIYQTPIACGCITQNASSRETRWRRRHGDSRRWCPWLPPRAGFEICPPQRQGFLLPQRWGSGPPSGRRRTHGGAAGHLVGAGWALRGERGHRCLQGQPWRRCRRRVSLQGIVPAVRVSLWQCFSVKSRLTQPERLSSGKRGI